MNLGQPVGEMEITPDELNAADLDDAVPPVEPVEPVPVEVAT
jgi:hypothetical protein